VASSAPGLTVRRGRLKGVDIRPGAVREARDEAGLSLAGVADGQLTRAAIHLIETGRSRPSMPTLELIARRTGKPISYFLADSAPQAGPRLPLDEVELLLERGELEPAVALAQQLLQKTSDKWSLAQLHCWIGQALARSLRPGPALEHLRQSRGIAEDVGDRWLAVECLDWEAAALTLEQDPSALEVAERALRACRELEPRPPATEARILSRIANIHLLQHEWERAVKNYEAALRAADELRDLSRVARIHQGLANAYGQLGDTTRAVAHTQRALALYGMLRDRASIVGTENNLGLALMKQGDLAGAAQHLRSAIDQADDMGMEQMKSHAILSLAELDVVRGSLDEAEDLIAEARELATKFGERLNIGVAEMLQAQVLTLRLDHAAADNHFQTAIRIFNDLNARERLIECHSAYADVLEARGATKDALEHTKLALAASRPALVRSEQGRREASQTG